jgi:hypothetical protein
MLVGAKATERPVKQEGNVRLVITSFHPKNDSGRLFPVHSDLSPQGSRGINQAIEVTDEPSRALEKAEKITISRAASPNIMTKGEKRFKANAWRQCSLQQCCFNLSQISGQLRRQFFDEKAR